MARLDPISLLMLVLGAAALCAALIRALKPLLLRYALARPNARSSHKEPTPQGGGIAVIGATILFTALALFDQPGLHPWQALALIGTATLMLAVVGAIDDIRPLAVMPRLLLQGLAVAAVIATLPAESRLIPAMPWLAERALMVFAGLWFVNLVNFMDGIDWITVAEMVPLSGAVAAFGLTGVLPLPVTLAGLALMGALIGFAPYNKPVAKLFLGDVGSLPIGLLTGWMLAHLALAGHFAAALLLPLYFLMDATITLIRRLARGEKVWQAHRSHFYQHATDGGYSVMEIDTRIFTLNLLLAALAGVVVHFNDLRVDLAALAAGLLTTGAVLAMFARGKR